MKQHLQTPYSGISSTQSYWLGMFDVYYNSAIELISGSPVRMLYNNHHQSYRILLSRVNICKNQN